MKLKTCCFTGHREIPKKEYKKLRNKTKTELIKLIENGVTYFIAGGARGYDIIAAEIVVELKMIYPHIKLILALPCTNQTKGWNESDIIKYNNLINKADKIKLLSKNYYKGCMHIRNRYMVDLSAYCVCYCRKSYGGTAYTVNYAIQKKLNVIYI